MSRQKLDFEAFRLWTRRRRNRVLIGCGAAIALLASLLLARVGLAAWARTIAAQEIEAGAVSSAQQWLDWSARLAPGDRRTVLMQATCFRQQHQEKEWQLALQVAQQRGVPAATIDQEVVLGRILSGEVPESFENLMTTLATNGVPLSDIYTSFVHGCLARGEADQARMILDVWKNDQPQSPHPPYMEGLYWLWCGDRAAGIANRQDCLDRAEESLRAALVRQPRHEAGRTTLAELFESQSRLTQALEHYGQLVVLFPASETARVCLARVLRKVGRLSEAVQILGPPAAGSEVSADAAAEMGQLRFEEGHLAQAETWFDRAGVGRTDDFTLLNAAASALALQGKSPVADSLFMRIDTASLRSMRIEDLRDRVAVGSGDKQAEDDQRRLLASTAAAGEAGPPAASESTQAGLSDASQSYRQFCAACHGASGDGNGRAARHLFPKPRDLRTGKSRLVSTRNGVPTLEDIEALLRNGMPGASMQPFEELTDDQRRQLAEEVLRLNQEGVRAQMLELLKAEGEAADEDEVRRVVLECTTPGELLPVPPIGPAGPDSVARGRDVYFALGCQHCHGDDGIGVADNPVYDEKGQPARARDLVHEPFKGGHDVDSVSLRFAAGMPGSP
ncbi:MAG: c-type cytochrome, partial [Thermoguttaceae bacterium]